LRDVLFGGIDFTAWLSRNRRLEEVEIRLSDKHIRAWVATLECGADYVLVLEDDAVFNDGSNERLVELILEIDSDSLYIDLAGGISDADLRGGAIEADSCVVGGATFTRFIYPLTNTTCAYIVHHKVLESFLIILMRHPLLRLMPADWMIDGIFMLMGRGAKSITCLHSRPPLLGHGSILARYLSQLPRPAKGQRGG
jgi:GR25 family glycosyltransferase involved in LPS biosynthesis